MDIFKQLIGLITDVIASLFKAHSGWYSNKYFSQVKALKNPYTTCFSDSVSWLLQTCVPQLNDITQDDVTNEINTKMYEDWTRDNLGQSVLNKFNGNLNQLWDVQKKFVQDKLNDYEVPRKAYFKTINTTLEIKEQLKLSPVVISTAPTYNGSKLGHVMMIVDYLPDTDEWVIDDPFGDFRCDYKTGHVDKGNDLTISVKEFEKIRTGFCLYIV